MLELDTLAGVYHRAYFEVVDLRKRKVDAHGLLAQGLQDPVLACVGLDGRRSPSEGNLRERVDRIGLELGATAFYMMSRGTDRENPQPNWLGTSEGELFGEVGQKLERLGLRTARDYESDLTGLRQMNNFSLDFLLFDNDQAEEHLVFHDRTVQAFFAAYWVMKYGTDEDLALLDRWIGVVDSDGIRSPGFDEFWQFAAQTPDRALNKLGRKLMPDDHNRWRRVFGPCYQPPREIRERYRSEVNGAYEWCSGTMRWSITRSAGCGRGTRVPTKSRVPLNDGRACGSNWREEAARPHKTEFTGKSSTVSDAVPKMRR